MFVCTETCLWDVRRRKSRVLGFHFRWTPSPVSRLRDRSDVNGHHLCWRVWQLQVNNCRCIRMELVKYTHTNVQYTIHGCTLERPILWTFLILTENCWTVSLDALHCSLLAKLLSLLRTSNGALSCERGSHSEAKVGGSPNSQSKYLWGFTACLPFASIKSRKFNRSSFWPLLRIYVLIRGFTEGTYEIRSDRRTLNGKTISTQSSFN